MDPELEEKTMKNSGQFMILSDICEFMRKCEISTVGSGLKWRFQ